jgi:hypothetical protein
MVEQLFRILVKDIATTITTTITPKITTTIIAIAIKIIMKILVTATTIPIKIAEISTFKILKIKNIEMNSSRTIEANKNHQDPIRDTIVKINPRQKINPQTLERLKIQKKVKLHMISIKV